MAFIIPFGKNLAPIVLLFLFLVGAVTPTVTPSDQANPDDKALAPATMTLKQKENCERRLEKLYRGSCLSLQSLQNIYAKHQFESRQLLNPLLDEILNPSSTSPLSKFLIRKVSQKLDVLLELFYTEYKKDTRNVNPFIEKLFKAKDEMEKAEGIQEEKEEL